MELRWIKLGGLCVARMGMTLGELPLSSKAGGCGYVYIEKGSTNIMENERA